MININKNLVIKLISDQFKEYLDLNITEVEQQGHDNRTYRIGKNILIRLPTKETYALAVKKEQEILPFLFQYLNINIPIPIHIGNPTDYYPYPFSIYKWLPGKSLNISGLNDKEKEKLAYDLANFLKNLYSIKELLNWCPGKHNYFRGDHIKVYDVNARKQIIELENIIDSYKALNLLEKAYNTKWNKDPVWIHGDLSVGNLLIDSNKLSAVIDFGCAGIGDPACDLVIGWNYFSGKTREIFFKEINLDESTILRSKAWELWKSTFLLCNIPDKNSYEAQRYKEIIIEIIN